jgi:hypothetical protein
VSRLTAGRGSAWRAHEAIEETVPGEDGGKGRGFGFTDPRTTFRN